MTRTGMASLILELRSLGQAGISEFVLDTTTYWSDAQLQSMLDVWQTRNYKVPLEYITNSGVDYRLPIARIERAGTDSGFAVLDSAGVVVSPTLYAVNYDARVVTFTTAQNGAYYSLNYRSYTVSNAVADVWGIKASYYADSVTWASDNHRVELGELHENALAMESKFAELSNAIAYSRRFRTDEVNWYEN